MNKDFVIYRSKNEVLADLTDYFFYIDIPTKELKLEQEEIIPYPRITFGYFFDNPFLVSRGDLDWSVDMVFSRISKRRVTVRPQNSKIKILGVHMKPYALAHLYGHAIGELPAVIAAQEILKNNVDQFRISVDSCENVPRLFAALEQLILENLISRNSQDIVEIIRVIEDQPRCMRISELAKKFGLTTRTIRNYFHEYVGCSPKEYVDLVQLRRAVKYLDESDLSLTDISYQTNYFDQSHFIKTLKRITGKPPRRLQKELPHFRFLQL